MSSCKRATEARIRPKPKDSAATRNNPINSHSRKMCSCGKMCKNNRGLRIHQEQTECQTPENKLVAPPQKCFVFLQDIDVDSIHSSFHYPVSSTDQPQTNWSLSAIDITIIDEASMVHIAVANHIFQTINDISICPIVIICSDNAQQQPFEEENGRTHNVPSMLQHPDTTSDAVTFTLTTQHRCQDPVFHDTLKLLQHWHPSEHQLDAFQRQQLVCTTQLPTDDDITHIYNDHPNALFLTISQAAEKRINHTVAKHIFKHVQPHARVRCDDDEECLTDIYTGMKVLLTQNSDKTHGVVNGQPNNCRMCPQCHNIPYIGYWEHSLHTPCDTAHNRWT